MYSRFQLVSLHSSEKQLRFLRLDMFQLVLSMIPIAIKKYRVYEICGYHFCANTTRYCLRLGAISGEFLLRMTSQRKVGRVQKVVSRIHQPHLKIHVKILEKYLKNIRNSFKELRKIHKPRSLRLRIPV